MSGMGQEGASVGFELAGAPSLPRGNAGKHFVPGSPSYRFSTGKPVGSPVSTAPSTPQCSFLQDPCRLFFRSISGTSTEPPEPHLEHLLEHDGLESWDELAERPLPPLTPTFPGREQQLEEKLCEVKQLFHAEYGHDVDDESEEDSDDDGVSWIKVVGTGVPTVAVLEERLAELKELYGHKFGVSVDVECEEETEKEVELGRDPAYEYDSDGTPWIKAVGQGPLTVAVLEERLQDLKALFKGFYGHDVESDSDEEECTYDSDGTPWVKAVGQGPLSVAVLEERLEEAEELCKSTHGQDVDGDTDDADYTYDSDGTPRVKAVGQGPRSVAVLEELLEEVKELYSTTYGQDVDCDTEDGDSTYDSEGTPWVKAVGQGLLSVAVLEERLEEVKELYSTTYGQDVDCDIEDGDSTHDSDGTPWVKAVGQGPLSVAVLEERLEEVKELYSTTYGQDVDCDIEDGDSTHDSDGTLWVKAVGQGLLSVAVLEDRLEEVKDLYNTAYGQDVDADTDDDNDYTFDSDGTRWVKAVGQGPLSVAVLEERLEEVKDLYETVYGQDVDGDEDYTYDSDGTSWVKAVGQGPLCVAVLEERLEEVKELYETAYGQDVDGDDEDPTYDSDGTPWVKAVGQGPLNVAVLEERLKEVKELYGSAYGQCVDIDTDDEGYTYDSVLEERLVEVKELHQSTYSQDVEGDDNDAGDDEDYTCDSDGTPWVKAVGQGPLNVGVLEERLEEVKALYRSTFGQDVDGDDEEYTYDSDGTPWVQAAGQGPLTVALLEESLEDVKELYNSTYGQDVDSDTDDEQTCEYDSDGTPWVRVLGQGPLGVAVLEERLEVVKALYQERYGHDVDAFDLDEEGTLWKEITGAGHLTVAKLEGELAEVKELFQAAYGRDVDDEFDEQYEYDADGTRWVKAVGQGTLTMAVLKERLEEVKELYKKKYGQDVDGDSCCEEKELVYDEEGIAWTKTLGTGPLTVKVLEDSLAEVKALYETAFREHVDDSSDDEECEYDSDGTRWVKAAGQGPLSVAVLEERLAEVKELYETAFGLDVDDESANEQQCEYDADGTPWVKAVGQGPLTVAVLEERLAEVKELYETAFGEDVDQSDGEYDSDGTPWVKAVGQGALSVAVLEERLEELKELYRQKYGRDLEEVSATPNSREEYELDFDGTPWIKFVGQGL